MNKNPKVSIIIPLYIDSPRFFEDLKKFRKLNYDNYEILVVSDKKVEIDEPKVKVILTGKKRTGPAEKRDIALTKANGELCAFIDDDAYPEKNWLKNALIHFQHPQIAAVGGPGVTPEEDGYLEQLTGLTYESFFCGGHARHRFIPESMRFVVDFPAYNLIVKKNVLKEIGGYGSHFYGGEDTFLCLKIIKKGYKILYDPKVIVYHHRRKLFMPYLKQIANIGKHRGYFAKKYPVTSRSLSYVLPSILTLGFLCGGILSIFYLNIFYVYFSLLLIFYLLAVFSVIKKTSLKSSLIVGLAIIVTHVSYGTQFVVGFFTKRLVR